MLAYPSDNFWNGCNLHIQICDYSACHSAVIYYSRKWSVRLFGTLRYYPLGRRVFSVIAFTLIRHRFLRRRLLRRRFLRLMPPELATLLHLDAVVIDAAAVVRFTL